MDAIYDFRLCLPLLAEANDVNLEACFEKRFGLSFYIEFARIETVSHDAYASYL
jgi:hypothetical protein